MIALEFGERGEARTTRIDLLCLSRDAGLVVVEIKRTQDGGHMELQAIRYAAMVSSMTLDQVFRPTHARTEGSQRPLGVMSSTSCSSRQTMKRN